MTTETVLTADEAQNIDHMVRKIIGDNRGFVLLVVNCDEEERTTPYIMSNLGDHEQVVEVLTLAADMVVDLEPETVKRGSMA